MSIFLHSTLVRGTRKALPPATASRKGSVRTASVLSPPDPQPFPNSQAVELHGELSREDPYRWLHAGYRDPRVLQYLKQENDYAKVQLHHLLPLRKQLEQEIAELSWQQAFMLAAQQPNEAASQATQRYGDFIYKREGLGGLTTSCRHLRVPVQQPASPRARSLPVQQHPPAAVGPAAATPESREQSLQAAACHPASALLSASHSQVAQVVLDEQQRAAASPSPSDYTVHSFSPSPAFDFFAFTETTEQVPEGERRPDRFTMRACCAAGGKPLLPPLPGVSGDVGWVSLSHCVNRAGVSSSTTSSSGGRNVGGPSDSGDGSGGVVADDPRVSSGSRLYFTRAAQRELWCLDMPASLVPAPHAVLSDSLPPATGSTGPEHAHPGEGVPPRLVFRDPDGQPVQLVQYGRHLFAESLGNNGVPLEVRLLGLAGVPRPEVPLGQPADGGVPLLPRAAGRHYSVVPFEPLPAPTGDGAGPGDPTRGSGNVCDRSSEGCYNEGEEGEPLLCGRTSPVLCGGVSPLLVWLRDLQHPSGCLLLALVGSDAGYLLDQAACVTGQCVSNRGVTLLELLPHDPERRIVHVAATRPGTVLCVRVAVDARGDPVGPYDMQELRIEWGAVHRAAALATAGQGWGSMGAAPVATGISPTGSPSPASAGGSEEEQTGGGSEGSGRALCVATRVVGGEASAAGLATVLGRRTVAVLGGQPHLLRVLGWDGNGSVEVSYSSLATPPAACTVRLMTAACPEKLQRVGAAASAAGVGAADAAATVELLSDGGNERFVTERLWATAEDGTQVPITLCRPHGNDADERWTGGARAPSRPLPLLLRVYGAYGTEPTLEYQPSLLPLLRRGVGVAVAHVRGGGLLGPAWYEAGRGANKANSYRDLLAAAWHLVGRGVTVPELLCLEAESAGGWAAGPALNACGASLFRAAVLTVPTLDVVTSLLEDQSYGPHELGDPRADASLYRMVLGWAPYDGMRRSQQYPMLLMRISLYDTSVPYWDPAKYMARLRNLAGGRADRVLQVMQVKASGHEAYDSVSDDATRCTFVLWALGCWRVPKSTAPSH